MVSIPRRRPADALPDLKRSWKRSGARRVYLSLHECPAAERKSCTSSSPANTLTFFRSTLTGRKNTTTFSLREGGFDLAIEGVREALKQGFRVTDKHHVIRRRGPESVRSFFDENDALGVEGRMLRPAIPRQKPPDQKHFLGRAKERVAVPPPSSRTASPRGDLTRFHAFLDS